MRVKAKVFALFRRRWARRPLSQCGKGRKEGRPWEQSPHCSLTGWREPVNVVVVSKFTVSGVGTSVQKPDMACNLDGGQIEYKVQTLRAKQREARERQAALGGNSKGIVGGLNHGLNHPLTHPQPEVAHL